MSHVPGSFLTSYPQPLTTHPYPHLPFILMLLLHFCYTPFSFLLAKLPFTPLPFLLLNPPPYNALFLTSSLPTAAYLLLYPSPLTSCLLNPLTPFPNRLSSYPFLFPLPPSPLPPPALPRAYHQPRGRCQVPELKAYAARPEKDYFVTNLG